MGNFGHIFVRIFDIFVAFLLDTINRFYLTVTYCNVFNCCVVCGFMFEQYGFVSA